MGNERNCSQCGIELPADAPQGLCPQCLMKLGLPTGAEVKNAAGPGESSDIPTSAAPPSRFVPPQPAEVAEEFPQLEILELLGYGGMGAVYKARQKQLDRLVALKILSPELVEDPAFAERFAREARSLAKLNHPRIVSVYDFGHTEGGLYYFIMEFVDGTDLRRVIQAAELSPRETLAIVPQICEALQYAHEEGVVHRDIKPENILLDKKGRVKIADFGLAKLLDRPAAAYTLTHPEQRMGTPHYMAPEQIEHPGQVDHRADIYSLGVVFYEMLTRELPIGRFAPPSQKVHVDVQLDQVVLRTLEKEPERRYQHASEVKTDVETIAREPKAPTAYTQRLPFRRRLSRSAVVGACWASLALLSLVLILWLTTVHTVTEPDDVNLSPLRAIIIAVPFLLTCLTAPFGTTILGFVAIAQIRHSAGRSYGMGLALFDALLFPLLALDAAIFAFFLLMFQIPAVLPLSPALFSLLLTIPICLVVDLLIVRWAWLRATKGLEPIPRDSTFTAAGTIRATTEKEAERSDEYAGEAKTGGGSIAAESRSVTQHARVAGRTPAAAPAANPMEKHVTLVAALNIGFGAIGILVGLFLFAVLTGSGILSQDRTATTVTSIVGTALGGFFVLTSVPEIIAGVGLLKRRGWAKVLVLIIAILHLIEIPIGTVIGIYTLWVMLNDQTAELFAQAAASRKAPSVRQ